MMAVPVEAKEILRANLCGGARVVVVGIGHELRGDDAVGVLVARTLIDAGVHERAQLKAIIGSSAPENVTGEIIGYDPSHVFLIDAADVGLSPGQMRLIEADEIAGTSFSTHMLPLSVVMAYLNDRLPQTKFFALGIQPKCTELMAPVCLEVKAAGQSLVNAFVDWCHAAE
jgi:hydrogenase 3 maturation protease